ncbi:MAG: hypothetical protein WBF17_12620 [Phycisphaerae bacterium]
MKAASEQKGDNSGDSQAWKTALCLGLMVLAVFAAWLAARIVRSHLESSRAGARNRVIFPGPASQPQWQPEDRTDAFTKPFAAVGLAPLDADPGKIPPPAGAKVLYAFQRRRAGETEQQAHYELSGSQEQATGHYTRVLKAEGFSLLKDGADATGRRVLVFEKAGVYATVAVRTNLQRAKLVVLVVTVVSATTDESEQ